MGPPPKNSNPFEDEEHTVAMGEVDRRALIAQSRPGASSQALPKVGTKPVPAPPKVAASAAALPAVGTKPPPTSASSQQLPAVGARPVAKTPAIPPRRPQSGTAASSFGGPISNTRDLLLGRPGLVARPAAAKPSMSQAELTVVAARFDGQKASPSVEVPAAQLKPVDAEHTSATGQRQGLLAKAVLDQFAPEKNSRYSVGECGHVFIGDFTRAMGCATPRFKRDVELTLAQVFGWFRMLSNGDGWMRVSSTGRAVELASLGYPVIALPKGNKLMLLAVARPDEVSPEGHPLLASACSRARGGRLTTLQAFGVRLADYYFHE